TPAGGECSSGPPRAAGLCLTGFGESLPSLRDSASSVYSGGRSRLPATHVGRGDWHASTPHSPRKDSLMPCQALPANAELEAALFRLYREFFRCAEKKRRWSVDADIPWQQVNPSLSPAIADVVESFCAVELYLPDYVANAMATFRSSR